MSKVTTYQCDIKDCNLSLNDKALRGISVKTTSFPVVFTTEQTEGKATQPYIDWIGVDLCEFHQAKLLDTLPITATGAMGHNELKFKEDSNQ